jgi:hypothetical protein
MGSPFTNRRKGKTMLMVDEELLRDVGAEEHGIFFVNRDGS